MYDAQQKTHDTTRRHAMPTCAVVLAAQSIEQYIAHSNSSSSSSSSNTPDKNLPSNFIVCKKIVFGYRSAKVACVPNKAFDVYACVCVCVCIYRTSIDDVARAQHRKRMPSAQARSKLVV